jgi:tripartite-type tricarboxylate transporter receptor subunit TctC
VVAAPSLGVKSIKDLIALAKAQPGQIKFGSSGVGSSTHFAGEQFKLAAGLNTRKRIALELGISRVWPSVVRVGKALARRHFTLNRLALIDRLANRREPTGSKL